jgi:hypothetical protein
MNIESEDKVFYSSYIKALKKFGSQRAVAKEFNIPRSSLQDRLRKVTELRHTTKPKLTIVSPSKKVRRFILSSAQNGTKIHEPFFKNLVAYSNFMDAEIRIAGFTYNKSLFSEHEKNKNTYHADIAQYLSAGQIQLGEYLLFCGEMNTLPTAVTPLSGFETYTRSKSGIFPHAKVQLVSVPTMKSEPAKQIMTTGAVTMPNYIQKRDGIKATFHHVIGAVIVEITPDGQHFCRHIQADDDGSFYDLDTFVKDGVIHFNSRVEAITWGDIHFEKIDPVAALAAFGSGGMLNELRPKYQFFHDLTDFSARNHHSIKDPYHNYLTTLKGNGDILKVNNAILKFLEQSNRTNCLSVIVESNHDQAMLRWMREAEWRHDPTNAKLFFELQLAMIDHMENYGDTKFSPFIHLLRKHNLENGVHAYFEFVPEDDSFTICNGEIECAIHGHTGANGAKGTPRQFTRMGPKANTAHTHSPGIIDGIYTAGTMSNLDLGYNKGLSSWAHTHIVTYPNAKRTLVTTDILGRFRAGG